MVALDRNQAAAARSDALATLVIAGPGSGKTAMLAERVSWLAQRDGRPDRILALTFTRAAALSMRARVVAANPGAAAATVTTFHSFFLSLLVERADVFGAIDGIVIDDAERLEIAAEALGCDASADWLSRIDHAREEVLAGELAGAFNAELRRRGLVDFGAMASFVLKALDEHSGFAADVLGRFDDVLVDEYQDVSGVQESLVRAFAAAGARIWAVGDDDQSLYGFRSSDVRRTIEFSRRYAEARVVTASTNYRCPRLVTEISQKLVAHNRLRAPKAVVSGRGDPGRVTLRRYGGEEAEREAVVLACAALCASGVAARDMVVLARTRRLAQVYGEALARLNVSAGTIHAAKGLEWPYVFVVGLQDGVLPGGGDVEEERRLLYVAITRARTAVALTFSTPGQATACRFLAELGDGVNCEGADEATWLPQLGALPVNVRRPMSDVARRALEPRRFASDVEIEARNRAANAPRRSYTRWGTEDDAKLRSMYELRFSPNEMALRLERNVNEVAQRVRAIGLTSQANVLSALVMRHKGAAAPAVK